MQERFSIVQLEVKTSQGNVMAYLKSTEGLIGLGQEPITDFCLDPWEADRPTLVQGWCERVVHELSREGVPNMTFERLRATNDLIRGAVSVKVSIVEVERVGLEISSMVVKESPLLCIQPCAGQQVKVVVLNF